MRAPLAPIAVAFLIGVLCAASIPRVWWMVTVGALVSAAAAWVQRRQPRLGLIALVALWVCLGSLRMLLWQSQPEQRFFAALPDEPRSVRVHGVVVNDPLGVFEPREPARQVCVVRLLHARSDTGWQPMAGRLSVTVQDPREPLAYGDEIIAEGLWSRVPAPGNPGQYDWQAALARKRIHGLLRVRPFDGLVVLRQRQGNPVLAAVFRLRERWVRLIQAYFEPRDAGLLLALLLGERTEIDKELKEAFVNTGTIHLLVISGFNVGLLALLIEWVLRLFGMPWRLRLLLSAIALGGYSVVTGFQPPVVRATLMAWAVLGGLALDRVLSWLNVLAAAALVIVLADPVQLFDPSFQLSFGAVLSLIVFAATWQRALDARMSWMHPGWLRRYVTLGLSATSAVWVGLAPLLAWYFHLVAPVSMLANLLLTPLMSLLIGIGTALLLLATGWGWLLEWSRGVLHLLLEATTICVQWCHALPWGSWAVGRPSPGLLVVYYALLGLSIVGRRRGWRASGLAVCWVVGVASLAGGVVIHQAFERRWLRVDVLDVGHGDSILVRTPQGRMLLIDVGSQEAGRFVVVPFLRASGIRTLDALVLTHPDEDHVGGAVPLLQAVRVRRLLTNGVQDDTMTARTVRRLATAQRIPQTILSAGMTIGEEPDVRIDVLHPPMGLLPGIPAASNDNSVVLKITKGAVSVLLTGDIEEAGLPHLCERAGLLRSTVLKVPHHGSRLGQAGETLFQAVRPDVAVLSVGRIHRLPAAQTLEALQRHGARVFLTRDEGAVSLRTDGVRLVIRTFRTRQQLVRTP